MSKKKIALVLSIVFCMALFLGGCSRKAKEEAKKAAEAAEVAKAEAEVAKKKMLAAKADAVTAKKNMLEAKAEAQESKKKADLASEVAKAAESTLNTVKGTLESTVAELAKVAGILGVTEKGKGSLEKEMAGVKKSLKESKVQAAASEKAQGGLAKSISELQKQIAVLQGQVAGLTKERDGAVAEAKKFEKENAELNAQVESYKKEMDQKKSEAKKIEEVITASEFSDGELEEKSVEKKNLNPFDPPMITQIDQSQMGVVVDATWVSKYIFRGFDVLDDKAAFQPSIDIDLGSGFSFNVWASFAGASKNNGSKSTVNLEEWDYILTYCNSVNDGQESQTDYAISWIYYDYPDMASKDADLQEFNLGLSWPRLCVAGFVPSYTGIYSWPSKGDGAVRDTAGFIHVFGVDYEVTCPQLEVPFNFSWDITYNDGTYGAGVDHDWSHMRWGLSTSFGDAACGEFTPAIYYQTSMEDSVNENDEFWVGVSYSYAF